MKAAVFAVGLAAVLWWSEAGHGTVGAQVPVTTTTTAVPAPTTTAAPVTTTEALATAAAPKPTPTTRKPTEPVVVRKVPTCPEADEAKKAAVDTYMGPMSPDEIKQQVGCRE